MHYHVLTPVDTHGQLDQVFNSYLHNLVSLEKVVVPHLSVAAHGSLAEDDTAAMGAMLYHLTTLNNSLHQLASCLLDAANELETFVSEGADLDGYARAKKDEAARQAGRRKRKSSDWQAKPQSLVPFQLHTVLASYFVGGPGGGERIGTSQPIDFRYHSDLLHNGLTFNLRDLGQPATRANLITRRLDEVVGQPDERWDGYDVSLPGPEAVAQFEALLRQCQQAATMYHSLAADDAAGYTQLFELLSSIVDDQ
jgi:hypothetical protein